MFNATQVKRVRDVFVLNDMGSGTLSMPSLRQALRALALCPSEGDLLVLIKNNDPQAVGSFSFDAFLALVQTQFTNETQRQKSMARDMGDTATLDAFVALGGNRDRSGAISTERLRAVVRDELVLPVQIDRLIKEVDIDGSGFIDFEEFKLMMGPE